jgi:hypothetical protein
VAKKPKNARSSTRDFISVVKSVHCATVKKISMQALILALTIPFGREHMEVKAQNVLIFL